MTARRFYAWLLLALAIGILIGMYWPTDPAPEPPPEGDKARYKQRPQPTTSTGSKIEPLWGDEQAVG